MNSVHFCERAWLSGDLELALLKQEEFVAMLQARICMLDVDSARQDVVRFINDSAALDIWLHDYFLHLGSMVKFA